MEIIPLDEVALDVKELPGRHRNDPRRKALLIVDRGSNFGLAIPLKKGSQETESEQGRKEGPKENPH